MEKTEEKRRRVLTKREVAEYKRRKYSGILSCIHQRIAACDRLGKTRGRGAAHADASPAKDAPHG